MIYLTCTMEPTKTVKTVVINAGSFALLITVFISVGVIVTGLLTWELRMPYLPLIGLAIVFFAPMLFQKKFRSRFIKNALLEFFPDHFTVELTDPRTGSLLRKDENDISKLTSFKALDSAKDDSSFLKLLFADGRRVSYTFLGQGKEDGKDDIIEIVSQYIHAYNEQQDELGRITYMPPLFASKGGTYAIWGLTLLLAGAILLELMYKPKAVPFTLTPGLLLYFVILLQRKRDMDRYNRMK